MQSELVDHFQNIKIVLSKWLGRRGGGLRFEVPKSIIDIFVLRSYPPCLKNDIMHANMYVILGIQRLKYI